MNLLTLAFAIFGLSFMIAYIKTTMKLVQVSQTLNKITAMYLGVFENLEKTNLTNSEDVHKENFIKFLSDSRTWAFDYIEDVQNKLSVFIKEVEPHINYYNKYGITVEGMVQPHDFALKKISTEFEKLKKLLPEESDDKR